MIVRKATVADIMDGAEVEGRSQKTDPLIDSAMQIVWRGRPITGSSLWKNDRRGRFVSFDLGAKTNSDDPDEVSLYDSQELTVFLDIDSNCVCCGFKNNVGSIYTIDGWACSGACADEIEGAVACEVDGYVAQVGQDYERSQMG